MKILVEEVTGRAAGDQLREVGKVGFERPGKTALEALYQQHGAAAGIPIQPVTFDRSDHQAFLDRGMPAVGVGEEFAGGDHTPHYHQATDTYDRVSFEHLATVTHLALSVLEASATAP